MQIIHSLRYRLPHLSTFPIAFERQRTNPLRDKNGRLGAVLALNFQSAGKDMLVWRERHRVRARSARKAHNPIGIAAASTKIVNSTCSQESLRFMALS